ncbi:MAG: recombination-associated protein RdgC [Gammaproteobacteria bacterium]|nr:MAG: recombination-associated protein RdgC [Gammaproteobacteria bacterium]RLA23440.1 MAG: recombination-associated protein RdgC [Gammaproteobacteria bacterium]
MWFKNLSIYRLSNPFTHTASELDEKLAEKVFHSVGKHDLSSMGWTEPLGRNGKTLSHTTNGYTMLCLRHEQKILPAPAIKELVDARAEELEENEARKVRGKERLELKEQVISEMVPRAFSRSSRTFAYIDCKRGWLIVDAASAKKAEEFISFLRESLGSFPATPISMVSAPSSTMTSWLAKGVVPSQFEFDNECELRDEKDEGGIVKIRKQSLISDEIDIHLKAGKAVTRLALTFDERISFVLDENMGIKRVRFLDVIQEEAMDVVAESAVERFDSDFAIMTLEYNRFLPALYEALGGLAEQK